MRAWLGLERQKALSSIHSFLTAADYRHALGGALAMTAWVDVPRKTFDIDLNITAEWGDGALVTCLRAAGVSAEDQALTLLRTIGTGRFTWSDSSIGVDVFLPKGGEFHVLAVDRAVTRPSIPLGLLVLTPTDLLTFKIADGRAKDWADVPALLMAPGCDLKLAEEQATTIAGENPSRRERLFAIAAELEASGRKRKSTD